MDSHNEAEISERVRLYIQKKKKKILPKLNFGLYGGDGRVILINFNGQQTKKVRKNIIRVFKDIDFSLEIKTNLKEADFLDVPLNLRNVSYRS